jgi:hypothetical protein
MVLSFCSELCIERNLKCGKASDTYKTTSASVKFFAPEWDAAFYRVRYGCSETV